jgi:hypothetical protein
MPKYDLQIMSWRAIDVIDPVARIDVIDPVARINVIDHE